MAIGRQPLGGGGETQVETTRGARTVPRKWFVGGFFIQTTDKGSGVEGPGGVMGPILTGEGGLDILFLSADMAHHSRPHDAGASQKSGLSLGPVEPGTNATKENTNQKKCIWDGVALFAGQGPAPGQDRACGDVPMKG